MMLNCKDVTLLISRSMDASLPVGKRIGVRIHLLMCRFCARYERHLLQIRDTLRRLAAAEERFEGPPGEGLSEEGRERMRKYLLNP